MADAALPQPELATPQDDSARTVLPEASTDNALTPLPVDPSVDRVLLGPIPGMEDPSPTMITAAKALVPGYMLVSELGRGGMGVVYRAVQLGLNRTVALKMVLAGAYADATQRTRFRGEAEAIAQLQHPGIVQIYEIGEFEGIPFYSLELVEGGNLAQKLQGKPFPPREAAQLVATLAQAVHAAHQKGIIHRDLKPANILLTSDGQPKITDFGLAKSLEMPTPHTADGAIVGTPCYMAPEQATGRIDQVGPATDVYSLGVILYEMLAGKPPFQGASMLDTLEQVRHQEPRVLHQLQKSVPRDLETICLKCLEKDPQRRYATAAGLAEDLQRYLTDQPILARKTPLLERSRKWGRRHPTATATLTLTGFLLLAVGLLAWWIYATYYQLTVQYHSTIVRRWGTWEGTSPLTMEDVKHRSYSFKLTVRGGRVEWCDIVDGRGRVSAAHPLRILLDGLDGPTTGWRIARIEFRRNDQGRVVEERLYDRSGHLVWIFHYTTDSMGHFTDAHGLPRARAGSGASYVEFRRNEQGFEEEIFFLDAKGERKPAADGSFGVRMEISPKGLRLSQTCLGKDGQPMRHRSGFTIITNEYDDRGLPIAMAYWDKERQPVRYRGTYHRVVYERDEWGNEIGQSYFDPEGKPMLHPLGFARMRKEYDPMGHNDRIEYLDLQGKLVMTKEGHAKVIRDYDERGDCVFELSYDAKGEPVINERGYHRKVMRYDPGGYPVEESYEGLNHLPVLNKFGYARRLLTPGPQEYVLDGQYFDLQDRPLAVETRIATMFVGSMAEQLGMKVGDVILAYAGVELRNRYHLEAQRHSESPFGPPQPMRLRRGNQVWQIQVPPGLLGLTLEDYALPAPAPTSTPQAPKGPLPMYEDFLQAVLAHPEEDVPRLIYADWLEEQGDAERAEYIRIQCELPHLPYDSLRRVSLVRRVIELERAHQQDWLQQLLPASVLPLPEYGFRGGFLEFVQIDVRHFLLHGETLVERTPLRHVVFTGVRNEGAALAHSPALERLERIDIRAERLEVADLAALVRSPHLQNLRALTLHQNGLRAEHLQALVASPTLLGLKRLDLSFNPLGSRGATVLAGTELLYRLEELHLFGCELRDQGIAALAAFPLPQLHILDLGRNGISPEGASTLADVTHWPRLEEIHLDENQINTRGARHLLNAQGLANVTRFYLVRNPIRSTALRQENGERVIL